MFASCIVVTIKRAGDEIESLLTYLHAHYMTQTVLTERLLQQIVNNMAANLYPYQKKFHRIL